MSAPIAMIPYSNMAPYRQLGPPAGCHFVPLVPRASIDALKEGRVVAAAVPVGGLDRLGGAVEMAGRFGIAARGPSMSVLLFSRVPFEAMQFPRSLRVTSETASSVKLLFLLFGRTFGFDRLPRLVGDEETPDGELLIGDRALVRGQTELAEDGRLTVTDLSRQWTDTHALPFVFARWVVRKDVPDALKSTITAWLEEFRRQEPLLVEKAVDPTVRALKIDPAVVRHYFGVIRRCLEDDDLRGQHRFVEEMARFGRDPLFRRD